ncbi:hypothetical protein [Mesoplasma seiffertii]|uniref:hypothetical protein n=1 Tax=Mesoplasma seiffertii TaxID=28224 RepID=UPI00047B3B39|nr:hypothetical protein [Mesoplasma seiffertii]
MDNKIIKFGNYFVEIFQNNKCIFRESNLVAYDLKTLKLVGAGNFAEDKIREKGNFLSTRFFENDKMINIESFIFYLRYLKSSGTLNKNEEITFVKMSKFLQELCKMEFPKAQFITQRKFYKNVLDKSAEFYVDLEYHSTWIYEKSYGKIFKLDYGLLKIQKDLHKYIYTNFKGLLNTKKTILLLDTICKKDFEMTKFELREFGTGEPFKVKIWKNSELMKPIEKLQKDIEKITTTKAVDGNADFLRIIKRQ